MLLITFEGIDGSGKSTQARLLSEYLQAAGRDPLCVRDPGGTRLSEQVRSVLLDDALNVAPMAELLLFSAARAQLVTERIRPALEGGRVVLCDRFYDSTTAYQGGGRESADLDWIRELHGRVTGGLVPDRTYLVEVSPEVARQRRRDAGGEDDRMEAGSLDFHRRVADAYGRLADAEPDRFRRLDGRRPVDALQQEIRDDVDALIDAARGTAGSEGGSSNVQ
jgi:dTMP kinase